MPAGFSLIITGIAVIAMSMLAIGGARMIRSGDRTKGVLMIVAALVLLFNLMIWSWVPAH